MKAITSPLKLADIERPIPEALARWGILGHALWLCLRPTKWQAYFQSIKRQVEERGMVPESAWGTPRRLAIARRIEAVLHDKCWPHQLSFHPNDCWLVIGEWEIGDLSELEALMEIEERFGLNFPKDFGDRIDQGLTFGDLVGFIEDHGSRLPV
jgi:hypothetical protein